MGEYAEMMLDGTCCAGCGEHLFNDDPWGFPEWCPACDPTASHNKPSKHAPQCEESGAFHNDWQRWLYTGITRASGSVTVVQ